MKLQTTSIKEMRITEPGFENGIQVDQSYLYVEDDILHVLSVGDSDLESALRMKKAADKITERFGPLNVLADINKAGKSTPEARKIWKELSEADNSKIALVGLHPVARVIASFAMAVSRNKNLRFFSTREEAMEWLKR